MTIDRLVSDVIVVEAVASVAMTAFLLAAGALRRHGARRHAMVRAMVRQRVTGALTGRPGSIQAPAGKRRVRPKAIHEIAEYAHTIGGADRTTLASVAEQFGLTDYMRRLATSMFWWRRLEAARLVTLFGVTASDVRRMAGDRNWLVRAQAATAAGSWRIQSTIPLLIDMLGDDAPLCRFEAKQALLLMGVEGAMAVASALRDDMALPPTSRLSARRADGLLDVAASMSEANMVDIGVAYSQSTRPSTRRAATALLAAAGGIEVTDRLTQLLDDAVPAVRCAAARALGATGAWPSAAALARHLDDDAYDVRLAVATALQRLGAPGTVMLRKVAGGGSGRAADMARQTLDVVEHLAPAGAT